MKVCSSGLRTAISDIFTAFVDEVAVVDGVVVDDFVPCWQNEHFFIFIHALPLGDEHLDIA